MILIMDNLTNDSKSLDIDVIVADTVDQLYEMVAELLRPDGTVCLNLAEVKYIDSCGISLLVRLHALARKNFATFILVNPNAKVSSLLRTTNLDTILNIHFDGEFDNAALCVMIVDDLPIICNAMKDEFCKQGISNVHTALNGADALIIDHNIHPTIVLLDYYMPILSGGDCLPILKRNHPGLQVYLMSAEEDIIKMPPDVVSMADHVFVKNIHMKDEVVKYVIAEAAKA